MVYLVVLFLYEKGEKVNIEPHLPVLAQKYPGRHVRETLTKG